MTEASVSSGENDAPEAGSRVLPRWLALLSVASLVAACASVIMGLLVMMDTQIEMNPHGDALVRQDAFEFRVFAWGAVSILILLLATGSVGGWVAYRRKRNRLSFRLSLVAAVPVLLLIVGVALLYLGKSP